MEASVRLTASIIEISVHVEFYVLRALLLLRINIIINSCKWVRGL